jgi:hypothetical protein
LAITVLFAGDQAIIPLLLFAEEEEIVKIQTTNRVTSLK